MKKIRTAALLAGLLLGTTGCTATIPWGRPDLLPDWWPTHGTQLNEIIPDDWTDDQASTECRDAGGTLAAWDDVRLCADVDF